MNKTLKTLLALSCLASGLGAAVITPTSGSPAGSDGYTWNVSLDSSGNDTTSFSGTVGSWSWEDASLGLGNGIGWRHQSDWIAINLPNAATVEIHMARNDEALDAKLFPSFTLYNNLTNTTSSHFFENSADLSWDTNLTHRGHLSNNSLGEVVTSYDLPAGNYTMVLGGNAVSEDTAVNVNYLANIATTPISIPEPTTSILALLAGLGFVTRRSR